MYFCSVSDERHYPLLMNLIGSIHKFHFHETVEISVYDLGLTEAQKNELISIEKVKVCEIEKTNPHIFDLIETGPNRKVRGLFSWKPVAIKQSLDKYPYVLYLDAGTTILNPLTGLFKHIVQNGYFLADCGHSIRWMATKTVIDRLKVEPELLADEVFGIDAGFMGVSKSVYNNFIKPVYNLCFDITNFIDDGTCPQGYGCGRHDQTLFSIQARRLNLNVYNVDREPCEAFLEYDGLKEPIHITHDPKRVNEKTTIFRSRWGIDQTLYNINVGNIHRKYISEISTIFTQSATDKKLVEPHIPITFISGVYNEEHRIRAVLEHATRWADEVIIVNKSSTDRTKEICLEYGDMVKVIDIPFAPKGHDSIVALCKLPKHDWIYFGTASEIPTQKLINSCREILSMTNGELDLVYVPRKYYSFGIHDKRSPWSISYFPFLLNRKKAVITDTIHCNFRPSNPHNTKAIEFTDDCCVYHLTHPNAKDYMLSMTDYFESEAASCIDPDAKIQECFANIGRYEQQLREAGEPLLGHYLAWPIYWLGTALFVWEKKRGLDVPKFYKELHEKIIKKEWLDYDKETLEPDNTPEKLFEKAKQKMQSGDIGSAMKYFEDALRINSSDRTVVLGYGEMLLNLKQYEKAKELYEKYLNNQPNDPGIQSLLQKAESMLEKIGKISQVVDKITSCQQLRTRGDTSDTKFAPRFFYIVTIHNKESMIEKVLDGISNCAQTGTIICVLDGCTDNTESIVSGYKTNLPIHKIVLNDVHELLSLNTAMEYVLQKLNPADDDFFVLLQDDVILKEPDFESLITNLYSKKKNLGYISLRLGCSTRLDPKGILSEYDFIESEYGHWKQLDLKHFKEIKHGGFEYAELVLKSPTCIPVGVIRKVGMFDKKLAPFGHDDLDLCIRLNQLGYANGVYALNFESKLEWGGTRENKNQDKDYHKNYNNIVFRNKLYLSAKHSEYYKNKLNNKALLTEEFERYSSQWKNDPKYNDFLYKYFSNQVDSIDFLREHSRYIGEMRMGFGEKPFHYLWLLLVNQMPDNFKFLEIGVYKGSILSLIKLISDKLQKSPTIYGITPLDTSGDKYLVKYDEANYLECITSLFNHHGLDISSTKILQGYSTDPSIKQLILREKPFDMIYIDGSHNYEDVVSDIELCDKLLKPNGLLILDDASSLLNLGVESKFRGHADVGNAIRDKLETNPSYKHLFACGHNRVFMKSYSLLNSFRKNFYSQNGEDGVLEEIFSRLGITTGQFVEFGAWDGQHYSNTYHLLKTRNWQGFYIESDPTKYKNLLKLNKIHGGRIATTNALVEVSGINSLDNLMDRHTNFKKDFEILSIDIDSYDYQIWESFVNYKPIIVIIEVNSTLIPPTKYKHGDNPKIMGSSFSSMVELGKSKGYTLICHTGNCIFVANDLVSQLDIPKDFLENPEKLFDYDSYCHNDHSKRH
jgi:tetratricopeptide (TPR) repeat protein